MKKRIITIMLFIALSLSIFAPCVHAIDNDMSLWVASSYKDVFQTDTPTSQSDIHLVMAQNEYEAVQIVLKCPREFTITSLSISDLHSETTAASISAENLDSAIGRFHK